MVPVQELRTRLYNSLLASETSPLAFGRAAGFRNSAYQNVKNFLNGKTPHRKTLTLIQAEMERRNWLGKAQEEGLAENGFTVTPVTDAKAKKRELNKRYYQRVLKAKRQKVKVTAEKLSLLDMIRTVDAWEIPSEKKEAIVVILTQGL